MSGIHVVDTGDPDHPAAGEPAAPALLFLHGLGGSAEAWQPQFDALAPSVRCVAWTMPGYGPSAPLADTTIETLADAAAELIDDLGIERAIVVGHSLGGYVAQQLAIAHPEQVAALILVATTAAFGKPGSTFNDEFLAARLDPLDRGLAPADLAPGIVDELVADGAGPEVRAVAVAAMSDIGADGYRQALRALVAWDGRDRIPGIDVPTACVAGDADRTAPVVAMERLQRLVPNSWLTVVERSGHLVNLEQPAALNEAISQVVHHVLRPGKPSSP